MKKEKKNSLKKIENRVNTFFSEINRYFCWMTKIHILAISPTQLKQVETDGKRKTMGRIYRGVYFSFCF